MVSASLVFDPSHDAAGNMTSIPKPSSLANGLTLKYDAWNRLVEVKDGETPIGFYEYDGLNRRLFEGFYWAGGPLNVYYHHFWNSSWQCLEQRSTTSATAQGGKRGQVQFVRSTLRAVPANWTCPYAVALFWPVRVVLARGSDLGAKKRTPYLGCEQDTKPGDWEVACSQERSPP